MLSHAPAILRCSRMSSRRSLGSLLYTPAIWLPRVPVTWAGTGYLSQMAQTNPCYLQPQLIHWDAVILPKSLRTGNISASIWGTWFWHVQKTGAGMICSTGRCLLMMNTLWVGPPRLGFGCVLVCLFSVCSFTCLLLVWHSWPAAAHQLECQKCKQTLLYI